MKRNVIEKWNWNLNLAMKGGKIKYHREIIIIFIPVAILVPNFPLPGTSFTERNNEKMKEKKERHHPLICQHLDSYSWLTDGFSSFVLFMSLRNITLFLSLVARETVEGIDWKSAYHLWTVAYK